MEIVRSASRSICFVMTATLSTAFTQSDNTMLCIICGGIIGLTASLGWAK